MTKKTLTIIYLEDQEDEREAIGQQLEQKFGQMRIENAIAIKLVSTEQAAIDVLSMSGKEAVLLSDLHIVETDPTQPKYPFRAWQRAAEKHIPILVLSIYGFEGSIGKIYKEGVEDLKRQFDSVELDYIRKLDMGLSDRIISEIRKRFPNYF